MSDDDRGSDLGTGIMSVVGVLAAVGGLVGLVGGAVHANGVASTESGPVQIQATRLDQAVYHCIDVQVHSLIKPDQPAKLVATFADAGLFLQATEGTITVVQTTKRRLPEIIVTTEARSDSCHGIIVEARIPVSRGRTVLRRGSGASVSGTGPLPNQL